MALYIRNYNKYILIYLFVILILHIYYIFSRLLLGIQLIFCRDVYARYAENLPSHCNKSRGPCYLHRGPLLRLAGVRISMSCFRLIIPNCLA
jgi:hypothetical protein